MLFSAMPGQSLESNGFNFGLGNFHRHRKPGRSSSWLVYGHTVSFTKLAGISRVESIRKDSHKYVASTPGLGKT